MDTNAGHGKSAEMNLEALKISDGAVDYDEFIACARYGDLEDIKVFFKDHADVLDVNHPGLFGNTALHMACGNGHEGIVQVILEHMASGQWNVQNDEGNTPLHWACVNGHANIVSLLLDVQADTKIKNHAGKTPLFEAQHRNHEQVMKVIIEKMPIEDKAAGPSEGEADEASSSSDSSSTVPHDDACR